MRKILPIEFVDPSAMSEISDVVVAGSDITLDELSVWCSPVIAVFIIVINLRLG